MSEYQIREGIVMEEILGRYLLISTEAALDKCLYVMKIEPIVAFYWEMMEKGLSIDEMAERAVTVFHDVNKDVLVHDIKDLIKQMQEFGYLLKDEELINC